MATPDLLVFQLDLQDFALPAAAVTEILHRAELVTVPGQPSVLEGFLDLRGEVLPVIAVRHLFGLPAAPPSRYSLLIVLDHEGWKAAIGADTVRELIEATGIRIRPLDENASPNHCAEGVVTIGDSDVILISAGKLLLEKEKHCILELRKVFERRLQEVESAAE